jgi:hypothetical protein
MAYILGDADSGEKLDRFMGGEVAASGGESGVFRAGKSVLDDGAIKRKRPLPTIPFTDGDADDLVFCSRIIVGPHSTASSRGAIKTDAVLECNARLLGTLRRLFAGYRLLTNNCQICSERVDCELVGVSLATESTPYVVPYNCTHVVPYDLFRRS